MKLSDYCCVTLDGKLRIKPHEAFLPKNELSHSRWPYSTIESLFNSDGSISRLCPVKNLQLYITISVPKSVANENEIIHSWLERPHVV